jgi:hypothetical protein
MGRSAYSARSMMLILIRKWIGFVRGKGAYK